MSSLDDDVLMFDDADFDIELEFDADAVDDERTALISSSEERAECGLIDEALPEDMDEDERVFESDASDSEHDNEDSRCVFLVSPS